MAESTMADQQQCSQDVTLLNELVSEVKKNYEAAQAEYLQLKSLHETNRTSVPQLPAKSVIISQHHLDQLTKQIQTLKQSLPKLFNQGDLANCYSRIASLQHDKHTLQKQGESLTTEKDHWKSRCQNALSEVDEHKQKKFKLQCELQEVSQQLKQQSEYCATMGAACCTLLWRVSRTEDSVQSILVGTKVDDFLSMVSSTIESYIQTYKEDMPQESTEETQFILAICGIVTNIAASPFGRNFLMTTRQGEQLMDSFIRALSDAPPCKCAKMKNLILMTLYNVSINQKGLKYLSTKPGIIGLLAWQLQEEKAVENKLHSIRLLQSLLYEQPSPQLLHEANEVLTGSVLQGLTVTDCSGLREAVIELTNDLKTINKEPQS